MRNGDYGTALKFPYVLGRDFSGTVAALGEGVTRDSAGQPLAPGDRVAYRYFYPCGHCRACLRRSTPRCPTAMRHRHPPDVWPHFNGAYGQYYYLQPNHTVFKVPDNVSDDLVGPANCALAQVIYGLEQARADYESDILAAQAGVASAEAGVRDAEIDLGYCRMSSPIAGRIGLAEVKVGNLVGPATGGGGADYSELAVVRQLDPMGVDIPVASRYLDRVARLIARGLPVEVFRPAPPGLGS